MELRQLATFIRVAQFKSFSRAAESLGYSQSAVTVQIRQLEEEGYAIEAVRNRGYRLVASPDVITAPELKTVLSTVWLGSQVNCFYETDSTNRQARKLAEEGAPHGTLVAADSQSAGKGRRGRAWASPRGVGVWMSFILRPELSPYHHSGQMMLWSMGKRFAAS